MLYDLLSLCEPLFCLRKTNALTYFIAPHHFPLQSSITLSFLQERHLPLGSRRSSTEDVTEGGLWPVSQVPYREAICYRYLYRFELLRH